MSSSKQRIVLGVCLAALLAGCAEPVREDRTIEFSRDGGQVAFQHGDAGVYVADAKGGPAVKIFQPDEHVLATSRPLASPTDGRMLFATAKPQEARDTPQPRPAGPLDPAGQIAWKEPVEYTCWLRLPATPAADPSKVMHKLFTAKCDHLGYVSGGHVVRWHPDGQRVYYIASLDTDLKQHTVFEYDLETEKTRRVFPHAGNAVLCDWTPGGSHLVCMVGDAAGTQPNAAAGIWIGQPDGNVAWWHLPGSEQLSQGELPSVIEQLRASRPAWTRNDAQLAFVTSQPLPGDPAVSTHRLQRVDFASRATVTLAESSGRIADLHWSPNGRQLGFVQRHGKDAATLRMLEPTGVIRDLPIREPVRKFAGFDATGTHIAYIVPINADLPDESTWWALLLRPDRLARDSVRIAPAAIAAPNDPASSGIEIFSGMRVTFPLWSPTEDRLSLWLTFSPRYRSVLSMFMPWGLWPGDPAATINTKTGEISWMAVTPQEELQIGHYHLMQGDPQQAWKWYAQARQKMPPAKPPENWQDFSRRVGAPENSQVFEALCLQRLGHAQEAAAKWAEFEQNFFPAPPANAKPGEAPPPDPFVSSFGADAEFITALVHDFYVAECYLSVDALDEALAHFRRPPAQSTTDTATLSHAIVLSQLLLISRDYGGYLAHSTATLAPLHLKVWQTKSAGQTAELPHSIVHLAAGMSLAPLFREDFARKIPAATWHQALPAWKAAAGQQTTGIPAVANDLVRRAGGRALGDADEVRAAELRLAANPATREITVGKPLDEAIASWFELAQPAGMPSIR